MLAQLPGEGVLSYRVQGVASTRPPLLLHRPLGGSMALWGEFGERLARSWQVIAFDPRGVGRSSDCPWRHSTRSMAKDAVALLDHLRVPRAHVFGLSLGGMVATWMAIDAADRVQRLVLASTVPRPSRLSYRFAKQVFATLGGLLRPGVERDVAILDAILSPDFRAARPDRLRDLERDIARVPATRKNLLLLALAAAAHDSAADEHRIRAETLLLFGRLDPIAGRASRQELLRELPHCRLEMLEGAGHDLSLERPIETAERILEFLHEA